MDHNDLIRFIAQDDDLFLLWLMAATSGEPGRVEQVYQLARELAARAAAAVEDFTEEALSQADGILQEGAARLDRLYFKDYADAYGHQHFYRSALIQVSKILKAAK
jgi:hypothetical protein